MDLDQQRGIVITEKVTGFLSMIGAGYVIYEVLVDKKKQKKPYFRLLSGMMLIEFTDGLGFFLGSWCVPAGMWWGAVGNTTTCLFQGWLLQFSIGSAWYNAGLALYYLLSIRCNWTERMFQQKVEPWIHIMSLGFAIGTATAAYFLDLYASIGDVCYFNRYPYDCKETYKHGYTTCEQGDNATLYFGLFHQISLWGSVVFTASCMILIWLWVRQQENRMANYDFAQQQSRKHSRKFAKQGALYVAVFYLSHIFASINLIRMQVSGQFSYGLYLTAAFFIPLEGFLNFLVYMRPRFLMYLKKRKRESKRQTNNNRSVETVPADKSDSDIKKHVNDGEVVPSNNGSIQNCDTEPCTVTSVHVGDPESRVEKRKSRLEEEEEEDVVLGAY